MGHIITDLKETFRRGNTFIRLIYINVGIFVIGTLISVILQLFNLSATGIFDLFALPASLHRFILQPWSLLSYMFMHAGFLHILFNMLWLYWFGSLFLYFFSGKHLRGLYVLGGICGGLSTRNMYCKVHRPVNTPGVSDNKGKCVQLVEYLSKELKEERTYYDNFFSQKEDYVTPLTVMYHMDNNHRTLKRNDDKFYMLTINPSGEEQQHLIEKVTGKKTGEFPELSPEQQKEVLAEMKRLTRECMDEYARNFYREKIRSGDDLVWYGRVETERHYKGDDPEVEAGKAKAGERKPGLQLHVHIIVSRMDRSQTVSLSPLSKSRGNRQVLDGRDVVVGFDRSQWSARCASRFNQRYGYFPYCRSKDEGLKEYSGEWKARNELRNETVSRIKREILHGEFREERRLYMNVCRLYRFVVNPRKAIIQELERLGTDLLTGRER